MRLLVSHQLLGEYMRAGGRVGHLIVVEAMYILYTEIKLLMLLAVWTILKIHINKQV